MNPWAQELSGQNDSEPHSPHWLLAWGLIETTYGRLVLSLESERWFMEAPEPKLTANTKLRIILDIMKLKLKMT